MCPSLPLFPLPRPQGGTHFGLSYFNSGSRSSMTTDCFVQCLHSHDPPTANSAPVEKVDQKEDKIVDRHAAVGQARARAIVEVRGVVPCRRTR